MAGRTFWSVNKTQPGEGEVEGAPGRGHHLSENPEMRPGISCLRNSSRHSRPTGHGKDGFCSKGNGEPRKVVEGERKGSGCLTSRRREEQVWNPEAWGALASVPARDDTGGIGIAGTEKQRQTACKSRRSLPAEDTSCSGGEGGRVAPQGQGPVIPPSGKVPRGSVLSFLHCRQGTCVSLLHGRRRTAHL